MPDYYSHSICGHYKTKASRYPYKYKKKISQDYHSSILENLKNNLCVSIPFKISC